MWGAWYFTWLYKWQTLMQLACNSTRLDDRVLPLPGFGIQIPMIPGNFASQFHIIIPIHFFPTWFLIPEVYIASLHIPCVASYSNLVHTRKMLEHRGMSLSEQTLCWFMSWHTNHEYQHAGFVPVCWQSGQLYTMAIHMHGTLSFTSKSWAESLECSCSLWVGIWNST